MEAPFLQVKLEKSSSKARLFRKGIGKSLKQQWKLLQTDGWCKTGDLGGVDAQGYLTVAGRKKDMIRSGGGNIYATEIEDVLYRHEAVKEVAVIGIPDPKYIEAVCAVIVKKREYAADRGRSGRILQTVSFQL